MVDPSFRPIWNKYVWFLTFTGAVLVLMLNIHCWAVGSQRNAASGVVESTASSTVVSVPVPIPIRLKEVTTPGVPIEAPFASHTRNFAGVVLPCLNTLDPSALMGCKIECPRSPSHIPDRA